MRGSAYLALCDKVVACPECLNAKERSLLSSTIDGLVRLPPAGAKHMAERQIALCGYEETLWLFDLRGFTNIFKDWYEKYIESIFHVYSPYAYAIIHRDDRFLLLRWFGERPRDIVLKKFWSDEKSVYDLVSDSRIVESECAAAINGLEKFLQGKSALCDIKILIERLSEYAAFALDNVFPEKEFKTLFPSVELSRIYWSPISTWAMLIDGLLDVLTRVYTGSISENEGLGRYLSGKCFLRWGDIESHDEDFAFTRRLYGYFKEKYPSAQAMSKAPELLEDRDALFGSRLKEHLEYRYKMLRELPKKKRKSFEALSWFAAEAQEYNERRRLRFTKSLYLLREFCQKYSLPWHSVSLESLNLSRKGGEIYA